MLKVIGIRYGLTLSESKNVTNIFIIALNAKDNRELHLSELDPYSLLGDPFQYRKKKLFILSDRKCYIFEESHNKLIIKFGQPTLLLIKKSGKEIIKFFKKLPRISGNSNVNKTVKIGDIPSRKVGPEVASVELAKVGPEIPEIESEGSEVPEVEPRKVELEKAGLERVGPEIGSKVPEVGSEVPEVPEVSEKGSEVPEVPEVSEKGAEKGPGKVESGKVGLGKEGIEVKRQRVFIISNVRCGGTRKYLDDITSHYKRSIFIYIKKKHQLLKWRFKKDDIIFIQHLFFTRIMICDLMRIKIAYNPILIISIHDFSWFRAAANPNPKNTKDWVHRAYRDKSVQIDPNVKFLFRMAKTIICPSKFCLEMYVEKFDPSNFIHVYHNDIEIDPETYNVPSIINQTINIGMMQILTPCKGETFVKYLKVKYPSYKGFKIRFLSIGDPLRAYKVTEFFRVVQRYRMHSLLHLNANPDTYSYTLSYSMNTGLPILYNNIGAFKERVPHKEQYFKVFDSENEMGDFRKLCIQFEKMLDYIIENNGKKDKKSYEDCSIVYREFYDHLFSGSFDPSNNIF